MFDFTRLTDELGGLLGEAGANGFSAEGLIAAAGLETDALQGLPAGEVLAALAAAGIDTSGLTEGQLGELMGALGAGDAAPE